MVVNKQMQKKANALPGMTARFQLQHDTAKRPTPAAPELDRVLRQCRPLQKYYQSLAPSLRKDFARYISAAKQPETRIRRAEQLAVRLIETMEAEVELPPLLRQAFSRNPIAAKGWQKMPPSHRRMHLLGIFYYRDLSSRLNRIEKAMVEMERFALRQDLRISQ